MTTVTGSDGKVYDYDGSTLTITGTGAVSSIVNGTVDSEYSFTDMTEVVIGEGITGLSDNAFGYCYALIKATLPSTLLSLPRNGFLDTHLTEIRIPSNVTSIGATFYRVYSLKKIIFDSSSAPTFVENSFGPAPPSDVGTVTVYSKGWANDTTIPDSVLPRTNRTVTFVTGVPETYEHITVGGSKVQVDSAIRDEDGKRIKTQYALKSEVPLNMRIVKTGYLGVGTLNPGAAATGTIQFEPTVGHQYIIFIVTYPNNTEFYMEGNGYGWQTGTQTFYVQGRNLGDTAQGVGGPYIVYEMPGYETSSYATMVVNGTKKGYALKSYVDSADALKSGVFRGLFDTWSDVPSAATYEADANNGTTPLKGDVMVVNDAVGYGSVSAVIETTDTTGESAAVSVTFRGSTVNIVYDTVLTTPRECFGVLSISYDSSATYGWKAVTLQPCTVNSTDYAAGAQIANWAYTTAVSYTASYPSYYAGAWHFRYNGVWGTDGKNGWEPEYPMGVTKAYVDTALNALPLKWVLHTATNWTDVVSSSVLTEDVLILIQYLDTKIPLVYPKGMNISSQKLECVVGTASYTLTVNLSDVFSNTASVTMTRNRFFNAASMNNGEYTRLYYSYGENSQTFDKKTAENTNQGISLYIGGA